MDIMYPVSAAYKYPLACQVGYSSKITHTCTKRMNKVFRTKYRNSIWPLSEKTPRPA